MVIAWLDAEEAENCVTAGLKVFGIRNADLNVLAKGDERKRALAWLVHTRTLASQSWISERLHMGNPSNISTYIRMVKEAQSGPMTMFRKALDR